jgi:hypothetical protein
VRFSSFPQCHESAAPVNNVGIGNIFGLQVKGVIQPAAWFLSAKDTAIEDSTCFLFFDESFGANKAVAEVSLTILKRDRTNHPVPIKGMMDRHTINI